MPQTIDTKNQKPNADELLEYALNIIPHTPTFKEFAVAMMEFMDEANAKVVIDLYDVLLKKSPINGVTLEKDFKEKLGEDTLEVWYNEFLWEQQWKTCEEAKKLKEDIDELIKLTEEYRNSDKFREMVVYIGNLPYLAPYNAMLVNLQKPGTQIAFSIKRWKKYNRRPKVNATPLIVLVPFGPIQVLYDYENTEDEYEGRHVKKEALIEEWCNMLNKTSGKLEEKIWERLIHNLPIYGIALDDSFNAASTYGGYLRKHSPIDKDKANIDVPYVFDRYGQRYNCLNRKSRFLISINREQTPEAKFHTLCHELGHLFCRHLYYETKNERNLTHKEQEFEAETVAWLVCKRHGIDNPSEKYLATYSTNGIIPRCSIDMMLKAVTEIEKMLASKMVAKDGLWYKHDKAFKDVIDEYLADYKANQKTKHNSSREIDLFGVDFPN